LLFGFFYSLKLGDKVHLLEDFLVAVCTRVDFRSQKVLTSLQGGILGLFFESRVSINSFLTDNLQVRAVSLENVGDVLALKIAEGLVLFGP
jgi:hypothetical protein